MLDHISPNLKCMLSTLFMVYSSIITRYHVLSSKFFKDQFEALFWFMENDDLKNFERSWSKFSDINKKYDGNCFLRKASQKGKFKIFSMLWEDPIIRTDAITAEFCEFQGIEEPPLILRISAHGNLEIFKILWQEHTYRDHALHNHNGALTEACVKGHTKIVEFLLQEPNVRANIAFLACETIGYAVDEGHIDVVKLLWQEPAVPAYLKDLNYKVLKLAVQKSDFPFMQTLLSSVNFDFAYDKIQELLNHSHNAQSKFNTCLSITMILDPVVCERWQPRINALQWHQLMTELLANYKSLNMIMSKTQFKNLPDELLNIIHLYRFHPNSHLNFLAYKTQNIEFRTILWNMQMLYKRAGTETLDSVRHKISLTIVNKPFFKCVRLQKRLHDTMNNQVEVCKKKYR